MSGARGAAIVGAHALAVALALSGLVLWEREGASMWIDAVFSFCS